MATPFATPDDVAARWRPLTDSEYEIVDTLLGDASDMIRSRWTDVDDRITAGTLSSDTLVRVVATMVKRAMDRPASMDGFETFNQTAGPFSAGGKVTNPNANLFLNAEEIRLLDGYYTAPRALRGWLA